MPVHINKSKLQDKKQQGILFLFWEKVFSAYFDITVKNKMLFKEKRFVIKIKLTGSWGYQLTFFK